MAEKSKHLGKFFLASDADSNIMQDVHKAFYAQNKSRGDVVEHVMTMFKGRYLL